MSFWLDYGLLQGDGWLYGGQDLQDGKKALFTILSLFQILTN